MEISLEKLCDASAHAAVSGQTHVVAQDDRHALDLVKTILSYFPSNNRETPLRIETQDDPERADADLDELIPEDPTESFDIKIVIERIKAMPSRRSWNLSKWWPKVLIH